MKPADQIPIKIKVKTIIQNDGDLQTYELTTFGRYYKKDYSMFLQYEEHQEEGIVKTIVKFSNEEALILRSGAIKMRLPFKNGTELVGSYETPFGKLGTITNTKKLQLITKNEPYLVGSVDITYDFYIQDSKAGTYEMMITFEEEKK